MSRRLEQLETLTREALQSAAVGFSVDRGELTVEVSPDSLLDSCFRLRDTEGLQFETLVDLCGVDYLDREDRPERFDVVLHLYSVSRKHHVRLKTPVPESDPRVDTITGVFRGANWFEREAWDLYGIVFKGHPNLIRLLTHETFVGHALRKDYPTAKRHVLKSSKEVLVDIPPGSENLLVNIGPSHPSMHGTFRVQALMDGETVRDAEADHGLEAGRALEEALARSLVREGLDPQALHAEAEPLGIHLDLAAVAPGAQVGQRLLAGHADHREQEAQRAVPRPVLALAQKIQRAVAPPGPNPVDVFTKSAPAALASRHAVSFSSSVRSE